MSRERNLIKNTGILALGQLSSKIFTFLLLPVYTSLLMPDDYGTVDVLQTIISLILYIVTLQLECAVFRFIIDSRDNGSEQKEYITSGLVALLTMSLISTIIIVILNYFFEIPHIFLFVLSLFAQGGYFYLSNIARGLGKNIDYSIASFVVTVSSLSVNIMFIVGFKIGAASILLALVISNYIGSIYYIFRLKIWKLVEINSFNYKKLKKMLEYSMPLIPNAISWWIANTSDRILILAYLGPTINGIYAAANKIPTIYTTIFSIFNIAWSESVSLSMKDNDYGEYIESMMNNSYRLFSFMNLGIITCMSIMFKLLIGENYSDAYNHIFILLVAIFINSMCSLLGGILGGLKDTKAIGWTTVVGAMVNFIINFLLIKTIRLYAASLSTLISYMVIYFFRKKKVSKSIKFNLSTGYTIQLFIMLCLVSLGYFSKIIWVNFTILALLIVWGVYNNRKILNIVISSILEKAMPKR